jgi:hypothetical protein
MDSDFTTVQEILDTTRPESTSVWMDRDDHPIWGGILWTRTYQSDGRVMQLNAQTFSSYPSSVVWYPKKVSYAHNTKTLTDNPHNILRYCYQYFGSEASDEYDIGLTFEDYHQVGDAVANPDMYMTETFITTDLKWVQDHLAEALKNDCEYRIIVGLDENGDRFARFESGFGKTLGVTAEAAELGPSYQYPGEISKYFMTNSSAAAPTRLFGVGRTQGAEDITGVVQGPTTNRIGVDKVVSYETSNIVQMTRMEQVDLANQSDLQRPVYEIAGPDIDLDWAVGDYRRVIINDPQRFPTRVGGVVRLTGWQLSPAESDSGEALAVTIDDASLLEPLNV